VTAGEDRRGARSDETPLMRRNGHYGGRPPRPRPCLTKRRVLLALLVTLGSLLVVGVVFGL
jgi:hypothetical protein